VCLYIVFIFVPYIIPTFYVRLNISYLIHLLCAISCVVSPFFLVKTFVGSFRTVFMLRSSTS
jgi:hypothetical protein